MPDDPYREIVSDTFTVEFLLGAEDNPDTVENVDAILTLDDGSRRSVTVITPDQIETIMKRWQKSGEYLNGAYFTCRDLVIVRQPGIPAITKVLNYMVEHDRDSLERLPDAD
ncbi:hypothetical protein [Nocardia brevicatena]|uniref:hypothetical protein n=1 Tax=Nocardia brevicatena TaxID=37327 RepID=UPI0002F3D4B4|nr:hypothetical protein [Nocardia brevicatena]